jgi:hypothetical protein
LDTASRRQLKLKNSYRPRPVRFLELWECGPWRIKLYGLTAEHTRLLPDLTRAAKELVRHTLSTEADESKGYGVGFAGIHCGIDANFVFIDWWENENELHHHVFVSTLESPLELHSAPPGLVACVFDLQVIWFERNAWVEKILANTRGPDVESYLKKVLSDDA